MKPVNGGVVFKLFVGAATVTLSVVMDTYACHIQNQPPWFYLIGFYKEIKVPAAIQAKFFSENNQACVLYIYHHSN